MLSPTKCDFCKSLFFFLLLNTTLSNMTISIAPSVLIDPFTDHVLTLPLRFLCLSLTRLLLKNSVVLANALFFRDGSNRHAEHL